MKKKNRLILVSLLVCLFVTAVPVSVSAAPRINNWKKILYVGNTYSLKVTGAKVKSWKSSNSSVVTVSKKGLIRGKKQGTAKVTATLTNKKKLSCTVTVKKKNVLKVKSSYISLSQMNVMLNILGAVETGGQVYGKRDYKDFTNPFASSPSEYSATAGAYQEYGENLRQLLLRIQKEYPAVFKKYDNANIAKDLKRTWHDSNPYRVYKNSAKAKAIVKIISSKEGKLVQDVRAAELIDSYLKHARSLGVKNVRAALFLAECEHLGGAGPVERIVSRASDKNSIYQLKVSLYKDQQDKSNNYQIGDKIYQNRHEKCYSWIVKYIPANAKMK